MSGRRMKRVMIAPEWITQMLNPKGGELNGFLTDITTDLPADARVVWVTDDPTSMGIVAFVESAEFEEVLPGVEVPLIRPTYYRTIR